MRYVQVHMKINIFRPSPSSNGVPYLMKLTNETPALDILPLIHRCFSKLLILNHRYFHFLAGFHRSPAVICITAIMTLFWMELTNNFSRITIFH